MSLLICPPQVGAAFLCQPFGHVAPPISNGRVISGQQNVRYRAAFPKGGLRVLRVLKHAVGKGLLGPRLLIPQHARSKPNSRADPALSGTLSTGQGRVPDADRADVMAVH